MLRKETFAPLPETKSKLIKSDLIFIRYEEEK